MQRLLEWINTSLHSGEHGLERELRSRLNRILSEQKNTAKHDDGLVCSPFLPGNSYSLPGNRLFTAPRFLADPKLYELAIAPFINAHQDGRSIPCLRSLLLQGIHAARNEVPRSENEDALNRNAFVMNVFHLLDIPVACFACTRQVQKNDLSDGFVFVITLDDEIVFCDFESPLIVLSRAENHIFGETPQIAVISQRKLEYFASGGELELHPKRGTVHDGRLSLESDPRKYEIQAQNPVDLEALERYFALHNASYGIAIGDNIH